MYYHIGAGTLVVRLAHAGCDEQLVECANGRNGKVGQAQRPRRDTNDLHCWRGVRRHLGAAVGHHESGAGGERRSRLGGLRDLWTHARRLVGGELVRELRDLRSTTSTSQGLLILTEERLSAAAK